MIKKRPLIVLAVLAISFQSNIAIGQGSLTPPGAPAPTMKALDQIEPRTPISSPTNISSPGSYYLTTNLVGGGSGAISINSGNVTLDLNGFTVQGGSVGNGISVSGTYTNITMRNGTIANWAIGFDGYSGSSRNVLVENLTVSGCSTRGIATYNDSIIRNCRVYGTAGLGIYSYGGQIVDCITRSNLSGGIFCYNGVIRNCHSEANNSSGLESNGGLIVDCTSVNNNGYGINLYSGASARRCHVVGNTQSGIYAANFAPLLGGEIADCIVTSNYYGINVVAPGYLISGNEVGYNPNAGIYVNSSNNRIDGNHVTAASGAYGIDVFSGFNNVIVRNSVFGSSQTNNYYIVASGNDLGPIGNASTNMSPWANISHN